MSLAIIVVAAGQGERLGLGIPKALVKIDDKTILEHCLQRIPKTAELIVVGPEGYLDQIREFLPEGTKLVVGGSTRQQSAKNGIEATSAERVLVHDAARCFTPTEVFDRVIEALNAFDAVIPAMKLTDTIKQIDGQLVIGTVNRDTLVAAQTPQGFDRKKLLASFSDNDVTDEAMMMEQAGHSVGFIEGDSRSRKITTADDLLDETYVGTGVDSHKFSDAGELVLGTLKFEGYPQLEGHSDGDALSHAIVDSLLAASRLGDIGSVFGVDDPKFRDAGGELFIAQTLTLLQQNGFEIVNVSCQLVADSPKIAPVRDSLQTKLSELIGAPVSVLATTTDGLGFLKDASGVGAVATASLKKAR
jgi:2-C-methyl-D-erythritol 4-phosphate cytidylyltransferase/2-C-methyl-D-erythritol 2,4-cyclodiphosphate synthase